MYKETNKRSIVKGISYYNYHFDSLYFFWKTRFSWFNRNSWAHERAWFKIRWGRKKIEPFNLWFTGLPLSGKTTIGDAVFKELEKLDIPIERIDSKDIREIAPNIGFTREDRNRHMHRTPYKNFAK